MWGRENNDSLDCWIKLFAVSTTEGLLDMTTALQTVFFLLLWKDKFKVCYYELVATVGRCSTASYFCVWYGHLIFIMTSDSRPLLSSAGEAAIAPGVLITWWSFSACPFFGCVGAEVMAFFMENRASRKSEMTCGEILVTEKAFERRLEFSAE